ncbi:putative metalloprotease CJM1_0395 family protein [Vogesella amnigena]|uniref:Metalloprotease CJM1_0395 family protein n=1 Tax=Vogesella amnigena TaxID=1507449 RepID=A0ABV7TPC4_9NEIS
MTISGALPAYPSSAALASTGGGLSSIAARSPGRSNNSQTGELSEDDKVLQRELQRRDREVRAHEQAHLAAASGIGVSGPAYDYQTGPDGVRYAIGGNVRIDVSPGRSPEDTAEKARTIQRAALAPAQPSGTDLAVAARARQMELQALAEQAQQRQQQGKVSQAYQPASTDSNTLGNGIDTQA